MDTNYFVCTLGQAASIGKRGQWKTVNDLVLHQAQALSDKPAVGFAVPAKDGTAWGSTVYGFGDVLHATIRYAGELKSSLGNANAQTVALLCPSNAEFLFTWLGLMRLGYGVLLLAPQCPPSAIAHLCKACCVSHLLYDDIYEEQGNATKELLQEENLSLDLIRVPQLDQLSRDGPTHSEQDVPTATISEDAVAYLHHTSGTSSGKPKPIPQTHRGAVGVLPHLPKDADKATYTTTPLCHGGPADIFRAWTSNAFIWLFPGKDVPITAGNILQCLQAADTATVDKGVPRVKYFTSVPYILQMMEGSGEGLKRLQRMDIVGVGGAALPAEVGDRLVAKKVNLVSRYGSAECGFLMSSHRDYAKDGEWQFLRSSYGAEALEFEPRDGGVSELVVKPGWPHMAKTNRPDGSYATSDLLSPQPDISNAWKYHSRADSQLTLITGKKFDPAPLEDAIATLPEVNDVLIFGNGKPFAGALVFRSSSAASTTDDDFILSIQPFVEKLNVDSPDHAHIPRNMLVAMPHSQQPLEKSSKGTILRGSAEKRYAQDIEDAYVQLNGATAQTVEDEDLPKHIKGMIQKVVKKKTELTDDTDLFAYGVDSVGGMQVRYGLRQLLPSDAEELSFSIVEDCGTPARLAEFVLRRRHGGELDVSDDHQLMLELVDEYTHFVEQKGAASADDAGTSNSEREVVLLTGATGALGVHTLHLLRSSETVAKVYCLVRGADRHAAVERINQALQQRQLPSLSEDPGARVQVEVLQCQLSNPRLGLDDDVYKQLGSEVTAIVHLAWSVNFRLRLRSFVKDSIASVQHLINFALLTNKNLPPKFLYCSSVASVAGYNPSKLVPESIISDVNVASPLGYSQSKWVAEQICHRANERTRLCSRIAVLRVGQLAGDSEQGVWNTKEAWPMMLSTVRLTRCLPALDSEPLSWLPVDTAATAFVEALDSMDHASVQDIRVFHVLNEHQKPQWRDLLMWLQDREDFDVVVPQEWLKRLEESRHRDPEHPAFKLLGVWKDAYGKGESIADEGSKTLAAFALDKSKVAAPVLAKVRPVDEVYFRKIWTWLEANMLS